MSSQLRQHFDIIINGGGIVGFTLLNLIQRSSHLNRFKVLLIEQATKPTRNPDDINLKLDESSGTRRFSNRVSSISDSSRKIFEKLEVWNKVKPFVKDVKQIKVWNYDYREKLIFNGSLDPLGKRSQLFSVVENNRLSSAILGSINGCSEDSSPIIWNHSLRTLTPPIVDDGYIEVTVENNATGEQFTASGCLILGCDGPRSIVRNILGFNYYEKDLNKTAIVGTVKVGSKDRVEGNETAYQRFSSKKDTVAALLPLDKEHSSFVISAPNDYVSTLMDCDEEEFVTEFNALISETESPDFRPLGTIHSAYNTFDQLLQRIPQSIFKKSVDINSDVGCPHIESLVTASRASFPLVFGTTSPSMVANFAGRKHAQVALLGDSTHRIHPLAGQGLNLGISDASSLVRHLEVFARCGENLFDSRDLTTLHKALKRYELQRQAQIIAMSGGVMIMPHLFKYLPSKFLSLVNACEPVKGASIKFANG